MTDFNIKTVDQIRIELVAEADAILAHLKALDELERHFGYDEDGVEPDPVNAQDEEPTEMDINLSVGKEIRVKRPHVKGYRVVNGDNEEVGHIARDKSNKWSVFAVDGQLVGTTRGRGNALDLLASHYGGMN